MELSNQQLAGSNLRKIENVQNEERLKLSKDSNSRKRPRKMWRGKALGLKIDASAVEIPPSYASSSPGRPEETVDNEWWKREYSGPLPGHIGAHNVTIYKSPAHVKGNAAKNSPSNNPVNGKRRHSVISSTNYETPERVQKKCRSLETLEKISKSILCHSSPIEHQKVKCLSDDQDFKRLQAPNIFNLEASPSMGYTKALELYNSATYSDEVKSPPESKKAKSSSSSQLESQSSPSRNS